jgi:hypothetical protein
MILSLYRYRPVTVPLPLYRYRYTVTVIDRRPPIHTVTIPSPDRP